MCTKRSCCHPLFCRSKNEGGGNENFWAICKNLRLTQHVELVESCSRMFAFCWLGLLRERWGRRFQNVALYTNIQSEARKNHPWRPCRARGFENLVPICGASTQNRPWRWRVTATCTNFGIYACAREKRLQMQSRFSLRANNCSNGMANGRIFTKNSSKGRDDEFFRTLTIFPIMAYRSTS